MLNNFTLLLGSVSNFMLWKCCACVLVRFWYKKHLFRVRGTSGFVVKYPFWTLRTWPDMSWLLIKNIVFFKVQMWCDTYNCWQPCKLHVQHCPSNSRHVVRHVMICWNVSMLRSLWNICEHICGLQKCEVPTFYPSAWTESRSQAHSVGIKP